MGKGDLDKHVKKMRRRKTYTALMLLALFLVGTVYINWSAAPAHAEEGGPTPAAPAPAPAPKPAPTPTTPTAPTAAPAAPTGAPAAPTAAPTAAPAPAPAAAAPAGPQPDPIGTATGATGDITAADATKGPTATEVTDQVGHNKVSINFMWTLLCGFLVIFMQPGFAMVEAGLTRAKNVSHTMAMNFMVYPIGMLGFYICGFALMWGGTVTNGTLGGYGFPSTSEFTILAHPGFAGYGLFGKSGFFLSTGGTYDVGMYCIFLFQMAFMDTTCTIPTGAMAERWKYPAFFLFSCFIGTIIYPIFGNWAWGGGWLSQIGYMDFAGSSVVHMSGGMIALVGAWLIGPRIGKYNKDGSANIIPAHNVAMVVIGTFILAFGWFGFNPGSTLAGTDLRIAVVATNTMLASATGAVMATLWVWFVRGNKPDPTMMCNGMLAGLVAITGPCAYVSSLGAVIIGLVAGLLVVESVFFFDRKLKIDDPVGAISVHGVNGAWGVLSIGLFADGTYTSVKGLLYGGGLHQLGIEAIGVLANFIWVGGATFICYKIVDALVGHRAKPEDEIEGLDIPEMGVPGYVGVVMDKASETPESR